MKTIEITVSPSGESTVRTLGFVGRTCQLASRFVESALGRRTSEKLTPEFHQSQTGVDVELEQERPSSGGF